MECGTCHKLTFGFLILFQSFTKDRIMCRTPCSSNYASVTCIHSVKCDNYLFDRKTLSNTGFQLRDFMDDASIFGMEESNYFQSLSVSG